MLCDKQQIYNYLLMNIVNSNSNFQINKYKQTKCSEEIFSTKCFKVLATFSMTKKTGQF